MTNSIVIVLICFEVLLIAALFVRIYHLYTVQYATKPEAALPEEHDTSIESSSVAPGLLSAQAFAIDQLLDISIEFRGVDGKASETLNDAISLYLIGAINFIGEQSSCCSESLHHMTMKLLKSQLELTPISVSKYQAIASRKATGEPYEILMQSGAEAARHWLENRTVPESMRLKFQLDEHLLET